MIVEGIYRGNSLPGEESSRCLRLVRTAHVLRSRKTGKIEFSYYWGDKNELRAHGLRSTHEQLNHPDRPRTRSLLVEKLIITWTKSLVVSNHEGYT
jgi:hypothetical protein